MRLIEHVQLKPILCTRVCVRGLPHPLKITADAIYTFEYIEHCQLGYSSNRCLSAS